MAPNGKSWSETKERLSCILSLNHFQTTPCMRFQSSSLKLLVMTAFSWLLHVTTAIRFPLIKNRNQRCSLFSQKFLFENPETFHIKWKGFCFQGKEPYFQFQTCNLFGRSQNMLNGWFHQQNGRCTITTFWQCRQFYRRGNFVEWWDNFVTVSIAATCCHFVRRNL